MSVHQHGTRSWRSYAETRSHNASENKYSWCVSLTVRLKSILVRGIGVLTHEPENYWEWERTWEASEYRKSCIRHFLAWSPSSLLLVNLLSEFINPHTPFRRSLRGPTAKSPRSLPAGVAAMNHRVREHHHLHDVRGKIYALGYPNGPRGGNHRGLEGFVGQRRNSTRLWSREVFFGKSTKTDVCWTVSLPKNRFLFSRWDRRRKEIRLTRGRGFPLPCSCHGWPRSRRR